MQEPSCPKCSAPLHPKIIFCESCGANVQRLTDPLPGRIIGKKYFIEKKIGRGGFSVVYAAKDLSSQDTIALKISRSPAAHDSLVEGRFRREALVYTKIEHPHIVQIYDIGEEPDGLLWIAMELLDGETLEAHMARQGALSPEETVALFSPLCDALHHAHQKNIIHRDLKPPNIALSRTKKGLSAKLLDFGIASLLESDTLTQNGAIAGSPPYMSPEQWEGLARTDTRSDLYSLGTIIYQCLSGRLPFKASTSPEWMKRHYFDPPLELSQAAQLHPISAQLSSAVMRALQKRPEDRYQNALQLKEALHAAIGVSPADSSSQDTLPDPSSSSGKTLADPVAAAGAALIPDEARTPSKTRWSGLLLWLLLGGALLMAGLFWFLY